MNIHDIAKIAGVSASTVSKVMNGKDKDISEKTRENVRKIIEENQYVPYLKFREKDGFKNRLLGLIVRQDNQERETVVLSAERSARQLGYSIIVNYVTSEDEIDACISQMIQREVSGLLIESNHRKSTGYLEKTTVYFGPSKEFDKEQETTVYYRLSEASRLATGTLIAAGHKKIACIVPEGSKSILDGYKHEMQSNNLSVQPFWMCEVNSLKDIEKNGIGQFLSDKITGIVCGSWEIACSISKGLARSGVSIPNVVSVISIGDNEILRVLDDGISAVQLPSDQMVVAAVTYLVDMIENNKQVEIARRFSPALIERKSVASPSLQKQGEEIVVVGSMNMDVTIDVSKIPASGENLIANSVYSYPGGKGGNQAVGVGKLGGQVHMIGCLGNDLDGKQLYTSLTENHVHMEGVLFDNTQPSGKAYITVDDNGESTIVVYPGANENLNTLQIKRCRHLFQQSKYCLLSMEIPRAIVEYTIRYCRTAKTEVILKPSSTERLRPDFLKDISYYVPNEHELNDLVPEGQNLEEKAQFLLDQGISNVIVTRGSKGCYLRNRDLSMYFDGTGFEAVDTTGGADSFISALAVYLSEGKNIAQAVSFAVYASGISVTRRGVQPALPDRSALDVYEDEILARYKNNGRKEEEK